MYLVLLTTVSSNALHFTLTGTCLNSSGLKFFADPKCPHACPSEITVIVELIHDSCL